MDVRRGEICLVNLDPTGGREMSKTRPALIIQNDTGNKYSPPAIIAPMKGIDTVAVVVSDRKKALAWYWDVLGLQVEYIGPSEPNTDPNLQGTPENPGHWVELGPSRPLTRVHLCELPDHRTEPGPTGITFLTDNIHADYERLTSKGVRFLSAPRKMGWGEWLCEFSDPNGNHLGLTQ